MQARVPIILAIQHDPIERATLTRVLKQVGYIVIPARHADDALDTFHTHHIDIALVLAEVQAPECGGTRILDALQSIDPRVPVLFMTNADAPDRVRLPRNVVATLSRPWSVTDLVAQVRNALCVERPARLEHWPPRDEDLAAIQVVDARTWSTLQLDAMLPVPTKSPDPGARIGAYSVEHRTHLRGGWRAVAAVTLCGLTFATLMERRGREVRARAREIGAADLISSAYRGDHFTIGLVSAERVRPRAIDNVIDNIVVRQPTTRRAVPSLATAPQLAHSPLADSHLVVDTRGSIASWSEMLAPVTSSTVSNTLPPTSASTSTRSPSSTSGREEATTAATNPPGLSPDEQQIYTALQRYERAYERLDVEAVRAVWPSLNTRALAHAFDGLKEQALEFSDCHVLMKSGEATAVCGGRASYVPRVGNQTSRSESREWTFLLHKVDRDWLIAKAEARAR